MKIDLFQVDAFTEKLFAGNPAAVCLLSAQISSELMQNIAAENNLAETAFVWTEGNQWFIRWFTPTVEVALCGHATLASAHVLFENHVINGNEICFQSMKRGKLYVTRNKQRLSLNFPADLPQKNKVLDFPKSIFKKTPLGFWTGTTDLLAIYHSEKDIIDFSPDFTAIAELDYRGLIISAPGVHCDFVSRFFGPAVGVNEDPVTGSAHTLLTPYWAIRLNKNELTARQLSERGGEITCSYLKDRVLLTGHAITYLKGEIYV